MGKTLEKILLLAGLALGSAFAYSCSDSRSPPGQVEMERDAGSYTDSSDAEPCEDLHRRLVCGPNDRGWLEINYECNTGIWDVDEHCEE